MDDTQVVAAFLQSRSIDRTYGEYSAASNALRRLSPESIGRPLLKVAIVRNYTVESLIPVVEGELLLAGFYPRIYLGDFDTITQDVFTENSALYQFEPDVVVVTTWLDALSPVLSTRFIASGEELVDEEVGRIDRFFAEIIEALRQRTNAPILLTNFPAPVLPTLGLMEGQSSSWQLGTVQRLNNAIQGQVDRVHSDVYVVNLAHLCATYGLMRCIDMRSWHLARAPIGSELLLPLSREIAAFVRAFKGKAKKCLVLDCDNTLWGGIIGEDGLAGIKLGRSFPGSGYLAFQEEIVNLHDRGIILALCSKNNEADVLQVLREHPDSVIREEHLATYRINWQDKVTNLREIAAELNIGLDSVVFVDDSGFEVEFVRSQLPELEVIHLKGNSSEYRHELHRHRLFDSLAYTAEDRRKNQLYRENRQRRELESSFGSLEGYLKNLDIQIQISIPTEFEIPRVAQLTQKTNQFNLTTRRYTEGQIRAFIESPAVDVFSLKVKDKISDLGLVGVAIVRYGEQAVMIDSFMLSCRVLGRGVESALLSYIVRHATQKSGVSRVVGTYLKSDKNAQVRDFYSKHGFLGLDSAENQSDWLWDQSSDGLQPPSWIKIAVGGAEDE